MSNVGLNWNIITSVSKTKSLRCDVSLILSSEYSWIMYIMFNIIYRD